jgi:hypothetical protein
MQFSIDSLLQLESYVKMVEGIRLWKETQPRIILPKGIIFNLAYSTIY